MKNGTFIEEETNKNMLMPDTLSDKELAFFVAQERIMIKRASGTERSASCGQPMPNKTNKAFSEALTKFKPIDWPMLKRPDVKIII